MRLENDKVVSANCHKASIIRARNGHKPLHSIEAQVILSEAINSAKVAERERKLVPLDTYLSNMDYLKKLDKRTGFAHARKMTEPRNSKGVWVGAK